jgi:hypothetical protein
MADDHGKEGGAPSLSIPHSCGLGAGLSRRTLLQSAAVLGAGALLPKSAWAAPTKQKGIFTNGEHEDPTLDADIIVTAAIVGHSWHRLKAGKNCKYDLEVVDGLKDKALADQLGDIELTRRVRQKLNLVLVAGDVKTTELVETGVTPIYTVGGRIIGGTGDLPTDSKDRYDPKLPTALSLQLYTLAVTQPIGYQGRGAYTGFVAGRAGGQTAVFSTYRHIVPTGGGYGRRWHPSAIADSANGKMGAALGEGGKQRKAWGMIVDNDTQKDSKEKHGMHFEGEPVGGTDVIGYTHGMIQAIYDVVWKKGGTPYEIAVGKDTTKLASCFACSVFMEATGHPASSTHLGRGESWTIISPTVKPGAASADPWLESNLTTQHAAYAECDKKWYEYVKTILTLGAACLEKAKAHLTDNHKPALAALHTYLGTHSAFTDSGNLFLDALTVHDGDGKRVDRTVKS